MARLVGMWIDHTRAISVSIDGDGAKIEKTESGAEPHIRLHGGWRSKTPWGPQAIVKEQRPDERRKHQLHAYYRKLITGLRSAESIYVFGPGPAPQEIAKEIERSKALASRLAAVEKADKMTDRQVEARVRKFFRAARERGPLRPSVHPRKK